MKDLLKKIKTLYEDEDVLAINKPSGLVVHSDGRTEESTVTDWMEKNYPISVGVGESFLSAEGEEVSRSGIVHRLDRETSGVLLLAKNEKGFLCLKKQFLDRKIKKTYRLFVYGSFKEKEGVINLPIGRSANDFRRWTATRGKKGAEREAVTFFWVLSEGSDFSYLEAMPKTGRTHQIRVHMVASNHPVVCDKLYASSKKCILGFERMALHSFSIEFKNTQGKIVKVEAPLPEDFVRALDELAKQPKAC